MKQILTVLAVGTSVLASPVTSAQAESEISLTRLECGTPRAPQPMNGRFSDTYAYGDLKFQFIYSCYLVKHGDKYLLWDTGHAMSTPEVAPKMSQEAF